MERLKVTKMVRERKENFSSKNLKGMFRFDSVNAHGGGCRQVILRGWLIFEHQTHS